jgi:glutamate carboxypeptidase
VAVAVTVTGLLALPSAGRARGALAPVERRMVAAVERHEAAARVLLERLVNVNSGTLNPSGVREVAALLEPEFEALGFRTRWADGAAWGRAGHLIAVREGRRGAPRVLLIGHLDTVFERDSPFQRWERLDAHTARGPGVIDMKGGDVAMLLALRALADAGRLDALHVTAVLTGDEERAGDPQELARRDLLEGARGAEWAIGFEDGDGRLEHAVIARRGSSGWRLECVGTPAHSSQIFRDDVGPGAILEAARVLQGFRDSLAGEPLLTFNPGLVLGGTRVDLQADSARGSAAGKSNVIAGRAVVTGDLRTISVEQRERAKAVMRRIAAASPAHVRSTLEFDDGYPPLAPTDGNRQLLAWLDRASRDLGLGPVGFTDPARAGAADISWTQGIVPMAIDGLGMKGDGGHTVGETGDLRSLGVQAKRAAVLLHRLASGRAAPGAP